MRLAIVRAIVVVGMLAVASQAPAANSVYITSMVVGPNQRDIHIPIYIENDRLIRGITCPLIIRSGSGGAFVTAVAMGTGDRLTGSGPLSEIRLTNHYGRGLSEYSICKRYSPDGPAGFGGIAYPRTHATYEKVAVTSEPYGVMFVNMNILGPELGPGSDRTGSYWLDVDVNGQWGMFEIDTTCVAPFVHIWFASGHGYENMRGILPHFTKGIITIMEGAGPNTPGSVPLDQVFRR